MKYLIFLLFIIPIASASLEINEILANPAGSDDAAMPYGEWVELYNSGNETISLKNYYLTDAIESHKLVIFEKEISPHQYIVIYRDEDNDFTLNNNGDEVKLYSNETLIDVVSYTKSRQGLSLAKTSEGWVIQTPTPLKENFPYDYTPQCDWEVDIWLNETITTNPYFKIKVYNNFGGKNNLSLERTIWNEKELVRSYENLSFSVSSTKSYTYRPQLPFGPHRILAKLTSLGCNDTNLENNQKELLIYVPNNLNTNGINYINGSNTIIYQSKGQNIKNYVFYSFCGLILIYGIWGLRNEFKKNYSKDNYRSFRCAKRAR